MTASITCYESDLPKVLTSEIQIISLKLINLTKVSECSPNVIDSHNAELVYYGLNRISSNSEQCIHISESFKIIGDNWILIAGNLSRIGSPQSNRWHPLSSGS